jgi:hypothetical protein
MGMSTHVIGIKPADAKYKDMLAAWEGCKRANVPTPREVQEFFAWGEPEEKGVSVDLEKAPGVTEWKDDMREGFEVDLTKLDPNIKLLRFYNSW